MVSNFDTLPRYFQRSSISCEVLFRTENLHWKAALGILAYINGTSVFFVIAYQRGTSVGTVFLWRFLPTQTTPVQQPTGGRLCLADQSCVEVNVYVGFPGRRNVSHVRLLKQSTLPLKTIRAQCNSRKTRCRSQIRSTLAFGIIFRESVFARGHFNESCSS